MIRVMILAASPVIRAGLAAVLAADPAMEIIGQQARTDTVAASIAALHPDVILADQDGYREDPAMGGGSWLASDSAALDPFLGDWERISGPGGPALVVLVENPRGSWIASLLREGAAAVLPRDATADAITAAVQAVATGLTVLPRETLRELLPPPTIARSQTPLQSPPSLTAREIEVLQMLAEGVGNKTIARDLGISDHTVKFHVASIMTKLNAASRTEAVTLGARLGLILL